MTLPLQQRHDHPERRQPGKQVFDRVAAENSRGSEQRAIEMLRHLCRRIGYQYRPEITRSRQRRAKHQQNQWYQHKRKKLRLRVGPEIARPPASVLVPFDTLQRLTEVIHE